MNKHIADAIKYNLRLSKNINISDETRDKAVESLRLLKLRFYHNIKRPLIRT